MKTLSKSYDCLHCQYPCCYFEPEDKDFSPLFTVAELHMLSQSELELGKFEKYKDSATVYRPALVNSVTKYKELICPFFNEKTLSCTIYVHRPLDCQIWPFYIVKSKKGAMIQLYCFDLSFCPSIENTNPATFKKYVRYLKKELERVNLKNILVHNSDLAWDIQPDSFFVTNLYRIT